MDPFAANILGVRSLIESDTNKNNSGNGEAEGIDGDKMDVLDLPMGDEELLKLRDDWEKAYGPYEKKIKEIAKKNKESYLGKLDSGQWINGEDTIVANLQFEAEETFLAAALAKNPEPVVFSDNTPEGNDVSDGVKTMLAFHSKELKLRRKLAIMVRQWSIYHLGVLKHGWDNTIQDVVVENRKIQDFVFDPKGYIDADGDFTSWLGERITLKAAKVAELFPKHEAYIELLVDGKWGTEITYTEWWNDDYCFSTLDDKVLEKHKNQYFKYPEPTLDQLGQEVLDDMGDPIIATPRNHFAKPKKPYTFLSVFSLQEQPHDITGLIEQNIPNQNRITRQTSQIDYNIASGNNSLVLSGNNFNQETGKQFAEARRKGNPALVPQGGPLGEAFTIIPPNQIPGEFFNSVQEHKNDLRTSWGVQGILATPQDEDQTARGMILNQSQDTTRIGGGIGSSLEGVAEATFNWLTQLYYVFYDEQHFAAIMGSARAVEYIMLSNADMDRQLIVSVSPDSLRPRDEITQINLAQALFDKGAIGPKTLLKMLDFPDPDNSAADGVLYRADPMAYLQKNWPDLAQQMMQAQQEKAMMDMQNAAQGAGMNQAAIAANTPPEEANGEPSPDSLATDPASAALSQVQLPA